VALRVLFFGAILGNRVILLEIEYNSAIFNVATTLGGGKNKFLVVTLLRRFASGAHSSSEAEVASGNKA
jgi:hypothetical protein